MTSMLRAKGRLSRLAFHHPDLHSTQSLSLNAAAFSPITQRITTKSLKLHKVGQTKNIF